MKLKPVLFLSGVLNLLLALLLISASSQRSAEESGGAKWTPSGPASNSSDPHLNTGSDNLDQVTVPESLPTFRWSQIESDDYAKYVRNLRSVGCPESTIRDIVEADMNQLFEPRYLEVLEAVQGFDYWRNGMDSLNETERIRARLAAVDAERLDALRAVLGEDYVPQKAVASLSDSELLARSKYGFLDGERQGTVAAIQSEFDALERQLRVEFGGTTNRDELESALAESRVARREALREIMSEEELFELDLRDSHAANSLRNKLRDFDVSEAEFRELFALRQAYEAEQGEQSDYSSDEIIAARAQARRELEEGYQAALGEDRYTDLNRSQDPTWQALKRLEENEGLSRELMDQAYELQREASQVLRQSMADPNLSEAERSALLAAARSQYQREMTALAGESAFNELGDLQAPSQALRVFQAGSETSIMMIGSPASLATGMADTVNVLGPAEGVMRIETQVIAPDGAMPTDLTLEAIAPGLTPGE